MLTRQWQMGEFKGEDTGSAVLAKLARRLTAVSQVTVGAGAPETEDMSLPAEARVERLPIEFPVIARARLGRRLVALLDDEAAAHPVAGVPYDGDTYRTLLRTVFPIDAPVAPASDDPVAIARARVESRPRRVAAALAGNAVDGVAAYATLRSGMTVAELPAALAAGIVPGHEAIVLGALERYRTWFDGLYPPPPSASGWDAASLEYRADFAVPRDGGTLTLSIAEHASGQLDWSSFDHGAVDPAGASQSTTDVRTVIPAPAQFAGMPNPRWWQFEDAAVDLGYVPRERDRPCEDRRRRVRARLREQLARRAVLAADRHARRDRGRVDHGRLRHADARRRGNGKLGRQLDVMGSLQPFTARHGCIVAAAPRAPVPAGSHRHRAGGSRRTSRSRSCATSRRTWSGASSCAFRTGSAAARTGPQAARRFTDELAAQRPPDPAPGDDAPTLRYVLGTEVPESWIPFLPVHKPADTRSIRLQRASMPRFVPPPSSGGAETTEPVRPRTSILRPGLLADDTQQSPYFLNEEEVARAGVKVSGALRRVRWLDGRTLVWHARTVSSGRGETDSGLRFDAVQPVDPRQ